MLDQTASKLRDLVVSTPYIFTIARSHSTRQCICFSHSQANRVRADCPRFRTRLQLLRRRPDSSPSLAPPAEAPRTTPLRANQSTGSEVCILTSPFIHINLKYLFATYCSKHNRQILTRQTRHYRRIRQSIDQQPLTSTSIAERIKFIMATRRQGQRMLSILRQRTRQSYRNQFGSASRMVSDNANPAAKRPGAGTWLAAAALGFAVPLAYQLYNAV